MDLQFQPAAPSETPISRADRDTFERVWRRVMPNQEHSPIALLPDIAPQPEPTSLPTVQVPTEQALTVELAPVTVARPAVQPRPTVTTPAPKAMITQTVTDLVPADTAAQSPRYPSDRLLTPVATSTVNTSSCLGESSRQYAPLLQQMMEHSSEQAQIHRMLAHRFGGRLSRVLAQQGDDHRKQLKRLSTAHFLITGETYHPKLTAAPKLNPSLSMALRDQFATAQHWVTAYENFAMETTDPCLRALYQDLAQETQLHAYTIRSVLEQL